MEVRFNASLRWLSVALVALAALTLATGASAKKAKLNIADASAKEGARLTFEVKLSAKVKKKVSASYSTSPGSASSDDFRAASGTIKIRKGKRKATVAVQTTQDSAVESAESLTVKLFRPKNAKIGDGKAEGRIEDDDAVGLPAISLGSGGSVSEGNPGSGGAADLQATLSEPSSQTVTADWSLTSGAQAADFVSSSGTISFPPGQTSTNVPIAVAGDYVKESDEAAVFTLSNPTNATIGSAGSLTVLDDDAAIGDLVITELLPNPQAVADADGEWIEIYNASDHAVNMAGLRIFTAATSRCTFSGMLASHALTLAAANSNPVANGGLPNLITCTGPITLTNTGTTVAVGPPPPDPIIDTMSYTTNTPAASLSLDPGAWTAAGNDNPANFCNGTVVYTAIDLGTPGALNPSCP